MKRRLFLSVPLALFVAACDTQSTGDTTPSGKMPLAPPSGSTPTPIASNSAPPTESSAPPSTADAPPKLGAPTEKEMKDLAKSGNGLAFDIYGKIRSKKGNLAFSPLSLSTALNMTWGGAKGDTAAQMKKVLHASGTPEQAVDASGKLVSSLADPSKKITLRVANRLFGEKTYTFEKPFVERTEKAFGAPIEPTDFAKNPEGSRTHINDWVAKQTNDRIKNLLPANAIKKDTRLVLTNAVYFLGDWEEQFKKDQTRPAAFHATKASAHDVDTMHHHEHFGFAAVDGVKLLNLPYEGGELSMTLVLPDDVEGLDAVEKKLDAATFDKWTAALAGASVDVALPKFKIDPAEPIELADQLKELGMPLAFDKDKADFTGMANPPKPEDKLYISAVFHKAFVKVDEKGTEAAAATAIPMAKAGAAAPSEPPKEFHADHPFLFFLRDQKSNMILFMGRVNDPKG